MTSRRRMSTIAILPAIVLTSTLGCSDIQGPGLKNDDSSEPISTEVVRVIDGDTITVAPVEDEGLSQDEDAQREEATIRLLGIDAPEMNTHGEEEPECGAKDATRRLTSSLPEGASVKVVPDPEVERTDRYGRTLAYVEISDSDGAVRDLGRDLVAGGFVATWYPKGEPEPTRVPEYEELQTKAQGRGNWPVCDDLGR